MPPSKLMSLCDAIQTWVRPGYSVAMGTSLEALIPFAAGHEIMRQQIGDLTLIGPISDILFDQLVGGGCVRHIRAAWVGNVITGSGYNFRRAVENQQISVEDHSNLTVALALKAGAMGVSFLPCRTALGSDLYKTNTSLKSMVCPFTGETLTAVAAITPDVAILHAQRSDEFGNAHVWGNLGITREACLASRHVLITAEEIVASEAIRSDPNRVVTPGFKVSAVVHVPWGAHPSPVPGYYNRDHQAFIDYRNASRTEDGFRAWQQKWVDNVSNTDAYQEVIGKERKAALALTHHRVSEGANYGY